MKDIIRLLRMAPHNAALLAAGSAVSYALNKEFGLFKFIFGLLIFVFAYSAAYIINDLHDLEYDKKHNILRKRNAPLVKGTITKKQAKIVAFLLIVGGMTASILVNHMFAITLALLLTLNVFYTYENKKHPNMIPYWHTINTYVKFVCGWSLICESINMFPWMLFIPPSIVYGYYMLVYKKPLMKRKNYSKNQKILLLLFFLSLMPLIISKGELSFKMLLALSIAVLVSIFVYAYDKKKGANASYIKAQYLMAMLICLLNLIIIA